MFKWNPKDYEKSSQAQLKWANTLLDMIDFKGDETVLDIGCGDGKISARIAEHLINGTVVGIDSSKEMIEYAMETHIRPNLIFKQINACLMNLDQTFDLIFSNAALHWIKEQNLVLKQIDRHLKPNGRLIISCGGKGNAAQVVKVGLDLIDQPAWQEYFKDFASPYYFMEPKDYLTWMEQTDLIANRIELVEKDMIQIGHDGLAAWIRTTWMPFTQRIPLHLQDAFVDEFTSRYIAKHPLDSQNQCHVKMVRLEVDAIKKKR